jgi:hypothetical protein
MPECSSLSIFILLQPEMIRKEGYPAESHVVQTDDGYLLTIHRIPGVSGSPAVFLQHGLLASSFDWVLTGKGKGLGKNALHYEILKFYCFCRMILSYPLN